MKKQYLRPSIEAAVREVLRTQAEIHTYRGLAEEIGVPLSTLFAAANGFAHITYPMIKWAQKLAQRPCLEKDFPENSRV